MKFLNQRLLHVLALSGTILAASALSFADPSTTPTPEQIKTASDEFEQGKSAAKSGDHEGAAVHFENADRAAPSPAALRAAIRARKDAKQASRSATLAERALARYPDDKDLGEYAKKIIAEFGGQLHTLTLTCSPKCLVTVDQRILTADSSESFTFHLDPGKHTVTAGWGSKAQSQELEAKAGGSSSLSYSAPKEEPKPVPTASSDTKAAPLASSSAKATPKTEPPPEKPAKKEGSGLPPAVFITGAVITGVLGATTIWSGIDTNSNPGADRVKAECAGQGTSCQLYKDGLSRQNRTNALIGVTAGVGAVTVIIGAFLTNWDGSSSSKTGAASTVLLPSVDPQTRAGSLTATGRF
ncbi:MAG: hypothetical protein U0165_14465 [Polyangiaceae bacterium]